MRYVDLDGRDGDVTGIIDPRLYLARLPVLAPQLPPGARAFATDSGHYDFHGKRCVKDLRPQGVRRMGDDEIEIRFGHNCFKHDQDLLVRYEGVSRFQVDVLDVCDVSGPGDVILDEVLPHEDGCTHEIACRPGTLLVACRDLAVEWVDAECAEARGEGR
ncbi:hypothetical protein [Streptomyces sp. NBC_00079]|uniref:hypothetical protein n=1 Tax=Streptomyces sp. NBC_00079 TaxID=2975644 RepID=UPI003246DCF7